MLGLPKPRFKFSRTDMYTASYLKRLYLCSSVCMYKKRIECSKHSITLFFILSFSGIYHIGGLHYTKAFQRDEQQSSWRVPAG